MNGLCGALVALLVAVQTQAVFVTGQSLAIGYNATPALSVTQALSNKIQTGTVVRAGTSLPSPWPLVDLVETTQETPCSGLANEYATLSGSPVVVFANGRSAAPYSALKKGTEPWAAFEWQIESFGARLDNTTVLGTVVIHGESDRLDPVYDASLVEWQADIEDKAHASTRMRGDVPLLVSQMSSCTFYSLADLTACPVPIGQYRASKLYPTSIVLVGPKYQYATSDGVHLTAANSRAHGALTGKVLAQGAAWRPVWPTSVTRDGVTITVDFNVPVPPLVLDTVNVANPGMYGFTYTDDTSPPAISTVVLSDEDTVTVTLVGVPTGANKKIRYAYTGTAGNSAGPATGMRGNLRDSDPATWEGASLYNWSVHFEEAVP